MSDDGEDLRARRRRETRERIAEVGLRMFSQAGYDETTMEAVAQASGIAPRTLFHYFKTKDQILRHWLASGFTDDLTATVKGTPDGVAPLAAARATILELIGRHEDERSREVDRVLNSTEALRVGKLATFLDWEQALGLGLRERYPSTDALQLAAVAMASIGALRLALEARRESTDPAVTLAERLDAAFDAVDGLSDDGA